MAFSEQLKWPETLTDPPIDLYLFSRTKRDFERDAQDLLALPEMQTPMHVLAHSYGAVTALWAACKNPMQFKSLCVIEPPAFYYVADLPETKEILARLTPLFPTPESMSSDEFYLSFLKAIGVAGQETRKFKLTPAVRAAVDMSRNERTPDQARFQFDRIRDAKLPILVVSGDWLPSPSPQSTSAGKVFNTLCDRIAEATLGERVVIKGSLHTPQKNGAQFQSAYLTFLRKFCGK